jgi:hypothetical protein
MRTACSAEALWIGIDWVPPDTPDMRNFESFSHFCYSIPAQRHKYIIEIFLQLLIVSQPTDALYLENNVEK